MSSRFIKLHIGSYTATIQDYRYKSRPPVGVMVSGSRLGESRNPFGEPCYFYESDDAMSMSEGIERAKAMIAQQSKVLVLIQE